MVANGSAIGALFNLIGGAQGAWNVVVTNPDGSSATLPGAFTIQPTREADIWVDLSGRDAIRASHTATIYTIIVVNRGNVDAFAVPIFLTGIPLNAQLRLLFDPLQMADVTDSTLSPIVSNDVAQSVPLLLPVVRAGTTNYFRFSIRSDHFDDGSFELGVFSLEPMLKAVVSQSASGQSAARVSKRSGVQSLHGGLTGSSVTPQSDLTAFIQSPQGINCLNSLFQAALNCGSAAIPQLNLLKGSTCAAGSISFVGGAFATIISFNNGGTNPDSQSGAIALAQLPIGSLSRTFGCITQEGAEGIARFLPGIGNILGGISCGLSLYDAIYNNCWKAYKKFQTRTVQSSDPNEKEGPHGLTDQHYIAGAQPMTYSIFFENQETATAPAQTVVVTDQLDSTKLDLSTFRLGLIGFGDTVVNVPAGLTSYNTDVDLRPAKNLIARIQASLDASTGIVEWRFQSIDPATNQPTTDPLAGFLPPNVSGTEGEGSVLFSVTPKAELASGTQISNYATIVFDQNAPIDTNAFTNTIDNSNPTSRVLAPTIAGCATSFTLQWSGSDLSGIQTYSVYVSDNGSGFELFLIHTSQTSATFSGQAGHTYAFYSIATDNTGNVENKIAAPDVVVTLQTPTAPSMTCQGNVTVNTEPGQCSAHVNVTAPTATDACDGSLTPVASRSDQKPLTDAVPARTNDSHLDGEQYLRPGDDLPAIRDRH